MVQDFDADSIRHGTSQTSFIALGEVLHRRTLPGLQDVRFNKKFSCTVVVCINVSISFPPSLQESSSQFLGRGTSILDVFALPRRLGKEIAVDVHR